MRFFLPFKLTRWRDVLEKCPYVLVLASKRPARLLYVHGQIPERSLIVQDLGTGITGRLDEFAVEPLTPLEVLAWAAVL